MMIPKEINLLYIEDDESTADVTSKLLKTSKHTKFNIVHKTTLVDGLQHLKSNCSDCNNCNLDVILLDLMLPNSLGINTYKKVKEVCDCIPVVIISGHEDIAHSCIELGAEDYLVKPDISPVIVCRSLRYAIERYKIKKQLKESQSRFELLTDANFEGVVISRDAIVIDINKQFCNILGVEREDIIGKKITEFVAPEYKEVVYSNLMENREEPYEHIAQKKDGTRFPVEVHGRTLSNGLRLTAIRDMTRYKEADKKIKKSESKYRELVEATGACIYEIDYLTMKFTYVNNVMCMMTGWNKEEFTELGPTDFLNEQGLREFSERMEALKHGEYISQSHEYEIKIRDGSTRWAVITAMFKEDEKNNIIGARVVAIDITDKKIAEQEANEKEETIFNELETKIQEWREELSVRSVANRIKLEEITLNINSMSKPAEVQ